MNRDDPEVWDAILNLLHYSWKDIGFKYNGLTDEEKDCISHEVFAYLRSQVLARKDIVGELYKGLRDHPDVLGVVVLVETDLPEGTKLPEGWKRKWLEDPMAELGMQILENAAELEE